MSFLSAPLAIAFKDIRLLARDRMGLFFVVAFPLMYALMFGAIFGGDDDTAALPVVVVDEDLTPASRSFADALIASDALEVAVPIEGQSPMTLEQARDRVRRGRLVAFIRVPAGFGSGIPLLGGGEPIELGMDPTRRAEAGFLQGVVAQAAMQSAMSSLSDRDATRSLVQDQQRNLAASTNPALDPIKTLLGNLDVFLGTVDEQTYGEALPGDAPAKGSGGLDMAGLITVSAVAADDSGPRSAFEFTFPSAMLWGVLGCSAAFAVSIVRERTEGTWLRLRAAPLSRTQVLAGKGLACFLTATAVMVGLMVIGRLFFHVRVSSVAHLALAIVSTAACFVGLMMLVSVLGRTVPAVSGASWALFVTMSMLGGGMVPLMAMPAWMQTLSHASPVKWGILALEGAIWRGFTLAEMARPCAVLLALGTVTFIAGVAILSRREAS